MTLDRRIVGVINPAYVIGKFYRVPAIQVVDWWGWNGFAPVIGPEHEDAEIIKYPHQHFHIDWRFASAEMIKACWVEGRPANQVFGTVVMRHNTRGEQQAFGEPIMKRMKCKRALPEYPHNRAPWTEELHAKFAGCKLINGLCPHRGISVSAMIRDRDALTCPGHGLRWSATTGELIPWTQQRERE